MNYSKFFIRGNYPNIRNILGDMEQRRHGGLTQYYRKGYLPPVLALFDHSDKHVSDLTVRVSDIPFVCQPSIEEAIKYVELIILARQKSVDSIQLLTNFSNHFYDEQKQYYQAIPREADEYVVPSTALNLSDYNEDLISQKGMALLKLSRMGYPTPEFSILTSKVYSASKKDKEKYTKKALSFLEKLTFQELDYEDNPLIIAIRSSLPENIPGLMPTYLNAGITDKSYETLIQSHGKVAATRMYLNNLKNVVKGLDITLFNSLFKSGHTSENNMENDLQKCIEIIKKGNPILLKDPLTQIQYLIDEIYKYFDQNSKSIPKPAKGKKNHPTIILHKMISTVRDKNSQIGILYSRHPQTGFGMQIDYQNNTFCEELSSKSGEIHKFVFRTREEIKETFPAIYHFVPALDVLENEFKSPVTVKYVIDATDRFKFFAITQVNTLELKP